MLSLQTIRDDHPEAKILSSNNGFGRSYDFDPYSGYDTSEETIFPVSVTDKRFPTKEVFYIVPTEEKSIAIQIQQAPQDSTLVNEKLQIELTKKANGEVTVRATDGQALNGYYQMWFSWAQHHQDNGEVWSF